MRMTMGLLAFQHPMALGDFTNWTNVLRRYGAVDMRFVPKALFVSMSSLLSSPLNVLENYRYGGVVDRTQILPPIFIVGHWRTGTTYLHQLMAQDPALGFVTYLQAMSPGSFIHRLGPVRFTEKMAKTAMKVKRPMDNIVLSPASPEEEEFALANTSPHSFLHGWYFPKRMQPLFEKYMLLKNLSEEDMRQWKSAYIRILKKAALMAGSASRISTSGASSVGVSDSDPTPQVPASPTPAGGKRLILKNPFNSTRITLLLELFPDAKFIHIYRNPFAVFASTGHLYERALKIYQFQDISESEIVENILAFYDAIMRKLLDDIKLIPAGNFTEVRYEDLVAAPMDVMENVYRRLHLPGFETAKPLIREFAASRAGFQKNRFTLDKSRIATVGRRWQWVIDKWKYDLPNDISVTP